MRLDAEKMRREFNQFDEQIANTKYQTEVIRLQSNYLVSKSKTGDIYRVSHVVLSTSPRKTFKFSACEQNIMVTDLHSAC